MVQLGLGEISLALQDGPGLRYATDPAAVPARPRLLLEFTDASILSVSIRMYGGIVRFAGTNWDNDDYRLAR